MFLELYSLYCNDLYYPLHNLNAPQRGKPKDKPKENKPHIVQTKKYHQHMAKKLNLFIKAVRY